MAHKKYRTNLDVAQPLLLPPRLDKWLLPDHLVYFVVDVVTMLDLSAITQRIQSKDRRGTRPFDPVLTVLKNRVQTVQPARDARRCNPPATPSGTTRPVRPPVTTAPGAHW